MKYIISLFIILSVFGIKAQESSTNKAIDFDYGLIYNLKLDQTYSRVAKSGLNHNFNFGYEKIKNSTIFSVDAGFILGILNTRGARGDSYNTINNYGLKVRFSYLKRLPFLSKNKFTVFAGGNLGIRGSLWFPTQALAYAWDSNLGIGLASSVHYQINSKLMLRYDLDVPLFGVLWRSQNNGQQLTTEEIQLEKGIVASVFETPRFSSPFNAFYIDNSLKLYFSISNRIDLYYNFNLSYRHIKNPLIKKGYEIGNAIGLSYNF